MMRLIKSNPSDAPAKKLRVRVTALSRSHKHDPKQNVHMVTYGGARRIVAVADPIKQGRGLLQGHNVLEALLAERQKEKSE